jgi:hypothetical protein
LFGLSGAFSQRLRTGESIQAPEPVDPSVPLWWSNITVVRREALNERPWRIETVLIKRLESVVLPSGVVEMKPQHRAETRIDVAGPDIGAPVFMILICSAWGLNHPLTKMACVDISPLPAAVFIVEPSRIDSTLQLTGILFYQSIGAACVGYLIYIGLLYRYQASMIVAFTFIAPLTGVLFSGIIPAEPLTLWLWLGLAVVSVGLWLVNTR